MSEIQSVNGIERVEDIAEAVVVPQTEALDVASVAAAEAAKAMVQGRIIMAIKRPRDIDVVRKKLLDDCKRPRFAETARYAKPMGETKVRGWSIRFAEAAVRHMGNIDCRAGIIAEDDGRVVLRFDAIDLESNAGFGGEIAISKTVERRRLRDGEVALKVRTNSRGEPTFTVRANEDDMQTKTASAISKGIRTYALRLVPADLLEECLEIIAAGPKQDPQAARKRIADAFASLGVGPDDLKRYAGIKDLAMMTDAQLLSLRELYTAIKEGDLDVTEVLSPEQPKASLKDRLKKPVAEKDREPGAEG